MAGWSHEEIVDAAIDALGTNLATELAAIYAAQAAADAAANRDLSGYGVPTAGLAEAGGDYYAGGASTVLRYPAVEVAIPDLAMENFSLRLADADVTENLVVMLWEQSGDMVTLYRKLVRLTSAAYAVLTTPDLLDGALVKGVRAAWRWNPEANERDEITSGALLVFALESTMAHP